MTGLLNDPVLLLGLMAFGALLLALPLAFWNLSGEPRSSTSRVVQLLVVAANLLLTAQLLWRWLDSGHFPISNLYESLCFLAWACTLIQLLVERAWPCSVILAGEPDMIDQESIRIM